MDAEPAHRACAELRFAEGLRRRSAEARAEATVREAAGLALLEGARVDPSFLRQTVSELSQEESGSGRGLSPDLAIAIGCWKATWSITRILPPLNPGKAAATSRPAVSFRKLFSDMQRHYGSALVAGGLATVEQISIPRDPARWAAALAFLDSTQEDAVTLAARAWALLVLDDPFPHGSQVMGTLAAKWILADRGVEPSAVSVLSAHAVSQRAGYQAALARAKRGDWEQWDDFFVQTIVEGCAVGQQIATRVQAGIPD